MLNWNSPNSEILTLGQARLRCFGGRGKPVLLIPSLINKPQVFDFKQQSLIKYLKKHCKVYLVDWGEVTATSVEAEYGMKEYICDTLQSCFDFISNQEETPKLIGYCMGGLMALLFASLKQKQKLSIITLGMPFDFNKGDFIRISTAKIQELVNPYTVIPKVLINFMFTLPNFHNVIGKYIKFIESNDDPYNFIEAETWVNDSINMAKPLFLECLENLIEKNSIFNNRIYSSKDFKFDLNNIHNLHNITCLVSKFDRVVSLNSSKAVSQVLLNTKVIELEGGHLSLVLKHHEAIRTALNS